RGVLQAVLGTVGLLAAFRVSGEDAKLLEPVFSPTIGAQGSRRMSELEWLYAVTLRSFSGSTLQLPHCAGQHSRRPAMGPGAKANEQTAVGRAGRGDRPANQIEKAIHKESRESTLAEIFR